MMKFLICFVCAVVIHCGTFAQDANYKDQVASGYKGGYIKGIKMLPDALNFIVVGDWGRQGEYYQTAVANQMSNATISLDAAFIISTGDNFYPDGVGSVADPLWKTSFEEVYHHFPLQRKWYSVLGNHDYRSNPQAQVEYSSISRRWVMPARYFTKTVLVDDDTATQVLFIYIDTNPFVTKYHSDEVYASRVTTQDTAWQMRWLDSVLSHTSANVKWKIVVGHHPLYTGGKRIDSKDTKDVNQAFKPLFDKYKVDMYLCGHEHHLEYIKPDGSTHYFISGSGSEVRPVDGYPKYGKFAASKAGFMAFSVSTKSILVQVIDKDGLITYTTTISK